MATGEANVWQPRTIIEVSGDTKSIEERFIAIAGQNIFTLTTFAYTLSTGALEVHKNGLLLTKNVDWVEQSSTTFSIVVPTLAADEVVATGKVGIIGTVDVRDTDIFIANYQAIRDYVGTEITLYAQGKATAGDEGEAFFQEDTGKALGFYVDNNDNVIVPTGGNGTRAWIRVAKPFRTVADETAALAIDPKHTQIGTVIAITALDSALFTLTSGAKGSSDNTNILTNAAYNTNTVHWARAISPMSSAVDYTTVRALDSSIFSAGDIVAITNDVIAGNFVVRVGTVTDNGGTLIVFTDDANKHLQRIYDILNLSWFGLGLADDKVQINKGLALGGQITADPNTYTTTTFNAVANTRLFGTKDVIFKLKDTSNVDLLDLIAVNDVVIEGITLDGNKANQTVDFNAVCVRSDGSENITLKDCLIKNSPLTGANMRSGSNIRILNNEFLDCGTEASVNSGDAIFLAFNEDDLVEGNRIINPARIGIVLKGGVGTESKGGRIVNNYVRSSGENAISAEDGVEQFLISNNEIDTTGTSAFSSTKSGIAAGELSVSGEISHNTIQDAGSIGIELPNGVTNMSIHDNIIIDPVTLGIQALASDARGGINSLSIKDNKIINPASDGIVISAALTNALRVANLNRDITIEGNQVIKGAAAGRDAIVASNMISFKIDNNFVKDPAAAGIRVLNSKDGSVSNNVVDGAGLRGIYIQGASTNCRQLTINGNTCIGCGTWGIFLTASDNAAVMNNSVKNRSYEFSDTHDGAGNAAVLSDAGANNGDGWVVNSLVGYRLYNITDGSETTVTANTATTVTGVLAGGTDDDWDAADVYELYTINRTATTVGIRSEGAGNANLIVDNDVRDVATGISSAVSGTADTVTPNFT